MDDGEDDDAIFPVPRDMRSANATDLAWADLPVLVQKRWAGHSPGSSVHFRNYVLDQKSFEALLPAVEELERLLGQACPQGLMIPTTQRCTTGNQSALHAAADHIDAALVDVGWLMVPVGEGGLNLCDTAAAAGLLGWAASTTRAWMATCSDAVDVKGHRHVPLDAVLAHKAAIVERRSLAAVAADLDYGYHQLNYLIGHHGLAVEGAGEHKHVPPETEAELAVIVDRIKALHDRAIPVAEAAARLKLPVAAVQTLIKGGQLIVDDERGLRNARCITLESIDAYSRSMASHRPVLGCAS